MDLTKSPEFHKTSPVEATKDISGLMNELSHNLFMLTLEEEEIEQSAHERMEELECVDCGQKKPKKSFTKLFHRGRGICKRCWFQDDGWPIALTVFFVVFFLV